MKSLLLFSATIFGAIGSYVPVLAGDDNLFSGWSILGGTLGGFFGIWVGVKLYKMINS